MIQTERRAFAKALEFAGSVVQRRSTVPVLQSVKITANGRLRIEGSDIDTTTCAEIEYQGEASDGFSLRDPRKVRLAINHAGGEAVTLEAREKSAHIECAHLTADIGTFPVEDHPGFDRIADERFGVDIGKAELAALARIRPAISTEETRYYLNGVCVRKVGDWLYRFCATDGHRLMIHDVSLPGAEGEIPKDTIIPRGFLDLVLARFGKSAKSVRLSYGGLRRGNEPDADLAPEAIGSPRLAVSGEVGDVTLSVASKLIDGTYPDVSRVIPSESRHHIEMDRAALVQAIHALRPFGEGKVRALRFSVRKGGLTIAVAHPDLGEAKYDIDAAHSLPLDFVIGFNGEYFLDCCTALSGATVRLELNDPGSPTVIRDPADTAFFSVLMPMRV